MSLSAINIGKTYGSESNRLTVLRGVDLEVARGEMVAIMGASGSGKTTLLQILGTLDRPSSGQLLYRGESLLEKSSNELAAWRNQSIGFVFQFHHLLPDFSALENVMMPALIAGRDKTVMRRRAQEMLARVELDHRLHHRVAELSGGEQQRTALARALIMEPGLLLADEPTGNLDSRAGALVFQLLKELCREQELSIVMVTHNDGLAAEMDRSLILADGILNSRKGL